MNKHNVTDGARDALLSRLTTREAQVFERIQRGRLSKQIADDMGISIKTVEAHRANIMEKINAAAENKRMNKYGVPDEAREQQISADREVCKVLAVTFAWALAIVSGGYALGELARVWFA